MEMFTHVVFLVIAHFPGVRTYECIRIDYGDVGGRVCSLVFLSGESMLICALRWVIF